MNCNNIVEEYEKIKNIPVLIHSNKLNVGDSFRLANHNDPVRLEKGGSYCNEDGCNKHKNIVTVTSHWVEILRKDEKQGVLCHVKSGTGCGTDATVGSTVWIEEARIKWFSSIR